MAKPFLTRAYQGGKQILGKYEFWSVLYVSLDPVCKRLYYPVNIEKF